VGDCDNRGIIESEVGFEILFAPKEIDKRHPIYFGFIGMVFDNIDQHVLH